jgi:hypothetical protein
VLGLSAIAAPGYEVFPFFCWFLFPVTPNQVHRYALELEQQDGRRLQPPVTYEALHTLGRQRNSMDLQVAVQAFGDAVSTGQTTRRSELRSLIEANFLTAPCAYRLVSVSYDPMQRWRGVEIERKSLGTFSCREQP